MHRFVADGTVVVVRIVMRGRRRLRSTARVTGLITAGRKSRRVRGPGEGVGFPRDDDAFSPARREDASHSGFPSQHLPAGLAPSAWNPFVDCLEVAQDCA